MNQKAESAIQPARPGRTLRFVLLFGFGGLLALSMGAGIEALSSLHQIQTADQRVRLGYVERSQSLLAIRSSLDQCDSTIEQYFLASGGSNRAEAAVVFPQLFLDIRKALASYPVSDDLQERALIASLGIALTDQENAVRAAFADNPADAAQSVFTEVIPSYERLIDLVRRIAVFDNQRIEQAEASLLQSYADLRANMTRLLIVILASGLALSVGSIAYILRQDREARERYAELAAGRREMSNLSARVLEIQEEERRAISRELHDEVGQSLGALLVDLGRLSSKPADAEQVERMKALAERSVNSVRNMALLLRPSMLDDLGLEPALEWQAREVSRRTEMEVEVDSAGIPEHLSEEYKICIYRLAQEALSNAARHSGGRNARVSLHEKDNAIVLRIHDDGHGFDPRSRGLGLLGMEERVRRLGGTFRVESGPKDGTTVEATLPL